MDETNSVLSSQSLIGKPMLNVRGKVLGRLVRIMIDTKEGVIAYAVFRLESVTGLAGRSFAIPWSALTVDNAEGKLIISEPDRDSAQDDSRRRHNRPSYVATRWF